MSGRPRDPAASHAIIDATVELLAERGYACLTMDEVAHRAGVAKATVYRRWPSKLSLVLDAVAGLTCDPIPTPETGSLAGDLAAVLDSYLAALRAPLGVALGRLLADATPDPGLRRVVRDALVVRRQMVLRAVLERAVKSGELCPRSDADLELVLELGTAALLHRLVLSDRPLDGEYAASVVDLLLRGAEAPSS